jgi:LuxR family maltose regulon positive regulatory protein
MLAAARAGSGDFEGAIEAYERGIELTYAEGNLVGAFLCIYGKAMYMLVQGQLKEAEQLCRSTINLAVSEGHGELPAAGSLYITMARINLERYHLNEAEVNMNTGLRIARPGGFSEAVRTGRYLRTHLAAAQGDFETAVDIFQQAERIVSAIDDPYLTGELNWEWAKFCLKIGDLDAAREKLHILEQQIAVSQHANMLIGKMWLFPRLLCAEGRFEEALTELDKSIHHTRASHSNGELIRLLALQAVVLDALGDHKYAFSSLHDALALGAEGGYIWRWLDAGPRIGLLLQDIRGDLDFPQAFHDYLDSLLDACQSAFGELTQPQIEKLPDLLTPREAEIIRLIGRGYSNPEIADELVVSLNTIKKHTSNIYGKLGVSSRTQAIARAHDLNLL